VRLIAVNLALSQRPAEPALFLAFAEEAEPDLAAIFFGHNRHPNRAPTGKGVVTIYWHHDWNTAHWDIDDHELVTRSTDAAERYIPGLGGSVLFHQINRWDPSFIYSIASPGSTRPSTRSREHEPPRAASTSPATTSAAPPRTHPCAQESWQPRTSHVPCDQPAGESLEVGLVEPMRAEPGA
jgi:hypothetical protein